MSDTDGKYSKSCTKCKLDKDTSEFSKRSASKDGLQPVCRSCYASYFSSYYESTKGKRAEYHKVWTKANRDYVNEQSRIWRSKNKDTDKKHKKAWADANPENRRARDARRRARKHAAIGCYTHHDVERLKRLQRFRCASCRASLVKFHVDHITPLAKGGSNDPSNLQILCPPCNLSKSKRDPVEFMQSRGFLC